MSEDIRNAFNAIIGHSYCLDHREVLNTLAELLFELRAYYIDFVAHSIPDHFLDTDDYDSVEEMIYFGVDVMASITSINYWMTQLTGEL